MRPLPGVILCACPAAVLLALGALDAGCVSDDTSGEADAATADVVPYDSTQPVNLADGSSDGAPLGDSTAPADAAADAPADAAADAPADAPTDAADSAPFDAGCDANIANDPQNCGACGAVCASGMCDDSKCTVVVSTSGTDDDGIVLDSTNAYFTDFNGGQIFKVPLAGGPSTLLATGQSGASGIAVDAQNLYWTNYASGQVMQLALGADIDAGALPTPLGTGNSGPGGIAVFGGYVYWVDIGGGSLNRVPIGGGDGAPPAILTGLSAPYDVVADATGLYFLCNGDGTVHRAALDGTGDTPIATAQSGPLSLAIDATYVYWADGADNAVRKTRKDGTGPTLDVATAQVEPYGIAVDSSGIYWTNYHSGFAGQILYAPLDTDGGAAPTELAVSGVYPFRQIATTASAVYWTDVTNTLGAPSLMEVAK